MQKFVDCNTNDKCVSYSEMQEVTRMLKIVYENYAEYQDDESTFFYSIFLWKFVLWGNHDYGGGAKHFARRIPIKEQYDTIFVNPQYDIPLFKLVCNDSVIISTHWNWSTFKIHGKTQDRMILEVLYNVSPLYHLDDEQWNEYKEDITVHNKIWSTFSKQFSMKWQLFHIWRRMALCRKRGMAMRWVW